MHVGMKSSSQSTISTASQSTPYNITSASSQSTISTASQSTPYNITSELQRSICEICSCTYRGSCLRCEQNNEYEESLRQDALANNTSANSTSGVVDSDFESDALTSEDLRAARISFLCKNHVSQSEEFGDDEVERFFNEDINENNEVVGVPAIVDDNPISEKDFLRKAFDEYTLSDRVRKTVIVQREQSKFWAVLFRQSLNLRVHAPNIRFAGEAGADAGGPLREFLTLVMKRIPSIPSMVFGNEKCICFTANPDSLIKQQYFLLGQISALSIIQNGRGPEFLHPAQVRSFYDVIDERWKKDRFAAIRELFEDFNHRCMQCLIPGDYLSLDETLYPMRTQIGFKQYNPNKPAKYGILFKSINAARYPYNFVAAPYFVFAENFVANYRL